MPELTPEQINKGLTKYKWVVRCPECGGVGSSHDVILDGKTTVQDMEKGYQCRPCKGTGKIIRYPFAPGVGCPRCKHSSIMQTPYYGKPECDECNSNHVNFKHLYYDFHNWQGFGRIVEGLRDMGIEKTNQFLTYLEKRGRISIDTKPYDMGIDYINDEGFLDPNQLPALCLEFLKTLEVER